MTRNQLRCAVQICDGQGSCLYHLDLATGRRTTSKRHETSEESVLVSYPLGSRLEAVRGSLTRVPPTDTVTHAHACTHTRGHAQASQHVFQIRFFQFTRTRVHTHAHTPALDPLEPVVWGPSCEAGRGFTVKMHGMSNA